MALASSNQQSPVRNAFTAAISRTSFQNSDPASPMEKAQIPSHSSCLVAHHEVGVPVEGATPLLLGGMAATTYPHVRQRKVGVPVIMFASDVSRYGRSLGRTLPCPTTSPSALKISPARVTKLRGANLPARSAADTFTAAAPQQFCVSTNAIIRPCEMAHSVFTRRGTYNHRRGFKECM